MHTEFVISVLSFFAGFGVRDFLHYLISLREETKDTRDSLP